MAAHAANPSYILVQVKRFEGFKVGQVELGPGGGTVYILYKESYSYVE